MLSQLARNLTNKLLHAPTAKLKQASATGRSDVIGITQELFELTSDDLEKEIVSANASEKS